MKQKDMKQQPTIITHVTYGIINPIRSKQGAMEFFGIGRTATERLGRDAGAIIKFGHNTRYDCLKMLDYARSHDIPSPVAGRGMASVSQREEIQEEAQYDEA